jgi:hypothetical protein
MHDDVTMAEDVEDFQGEVNQYLKLAYIESMSSGPSNHLKVPGHF